MVTSKKVGVNNRGKGTATDGGKASAPSKPPKRDPVRRREQNRQSQKTYREKQRRRIEELERIAAAAAAGASSSDDPVKKPGLFSVTSEEASEQAREQAGGPPDNLVAGDDTIDPSVLGTSTDHVSFQGVTDLIGPSDLMVDFDQWLSNGTGNNRSSLPAATSTSTSTGTPSQGSNPAVDEVVYDCRCDNIHVITPTSSIVINMTPSPFRNTLRLDVWCALAGLLENCLLLGIPKAHFCGDFSESPFFRRGSSDLESAQLAASVHSMYSRSISAYDLRPSHAQVVNSHHPYIDVLPFRDLRDNMIRAVVAGEAGRGPVVDEDDFLTDYFEHVTCWGGVAGAKTGTPWDGRSWEASEFFLQKWAFIIGGDDGELTRQSRWWRTMRGETDTGSSNLVDMALL